MTLRFATTYRGKPVSEMSRTELLEVIEWQAAELDRYTNTDAIRAMAIGKAELMKRRARP